MSRKKVTVMNVTMINNMIMFMRHREPRNTETGCLISAPWYHHRLMALLKQPWPLAGGGATRTQMILPAMTRASWPRSVESLARRLP